MACMTQQITDAINTDVIPAYKSFAEFLTKVYAPEGRTTLSVTSLPDGEKRYENDIYARTTTHMTPDEIHKIGLHEIDRIEAGMHGDREKEGFAIWLLFAHRSRPMPSTFPRRRSRFSKIIGITRGRWSRSCRSYLRCYRSRRLRWRRSRRFRLRLRRTT